MRKFKAMSFATKMVILFTVLLVCIFIETAGTQKTRSVAERAREVAPLATYVEPTTVTPARKITEARPVITTTTTVVTTKATTTKVAKTTTKKVVKSTTKKVVKSTTKKSSKTRSKVYLGKFKITFYCSCATCCGKSDGITASGARVQRGVTIATNPSEIPLGSRVYIEGFGNRIAQDTGGFGSNTIDIYVESHARAYELGVQYKKVYIYK